jgi:hypothetical protein
MSAYTESNFNACLDAICIIKKQRDTAIRIAECFDIAGLEKRDRLLLSERLADLQREVRDFQNRKQKQSASPS